MCQARTWWPNIHASATRQEVRLSALIWAETGYVEIDGLKVYYRELGEGSPIVVVHGGLATGDSWGEHILALAQNHRVLAPDSRGHGRTNNPAGRLSYSLMADDVAGFIAALKLQRPVVLGYSDGAQIALELGMRDPEQVKALVIGAAVTQPTETYLDALRAMGFPRPGAVDFEQLERAFGDFLEFIKTEHQHVYGPDYWRTFLGQISELWLTVPSYTAEQLAGIPVPSLILTGDRDESLDHSVRLYRTIPQAELAVIPNADHTAVNQRLFWEPVGDFVSRHA
jgi:pimeloyl-ACP methyl ester carboxylesterase